MSVGIAFVKRLLEAFLSGFAVAFGVNLFVFPVSARRVVFSDFSKYIAAIRGSLKAETFYLHALEEKDVFSVPSKSNEKPKISQPAKDLKAALAGLMGIHAKLHGDMAFAKREIAYGKLCADDLEKLRQLLRQVLIPVLGIGAVADLFDRVAEQRGWKETSVSGIESPLQLEARKTRSQEVHEWNDVFTIMHKPLESIREALGDALQHVLYTLELQKLPRKATTKQDPEAQIDMKPGDPAFATHIRKKIEDFYAQRQNTLRFWCNQKGIHLPKDYSQRPPQSPIPINIENETADQHKRNKRQLYLILYVRGHFSSTCSFNLEN